MARFQAMQVGAYANGWGDNFANLITQIIASIPGDKKRSAALAKRLEGKKQAADWPWLLEKAKKVGESR